MDPFQASSLRLPLAAIALSATVALALVAPEAGAQVEPIPSGADATQVNLSPVGVYEMPSPLVSKLRVTELSGRPNEYRVEVYAGGDPRDGSGVAAHCLTVAEGRLVGNRIDGRLLIEKDLGGSGNANLTSAPRLVLTFQGNAVHLEGDFNHCPMRAAIAGTYRRTQGPNRF
ncbi:hypothetical protein OSJ77_03200 [Phyllobacterium sp. 0TCS1.6C]|uniref:hypothetical protein n=1 Tax=unclassified Phyllobacterium TaxID=2638441 RepID=UPI0022652FCC|nr:MULTISPECIES: hypothetical protein [unclassified Phyllobacterium]MCX8279186.1 hypothetical protein [Phyllobacterium sp. 0TCS1.6C]MCX8293970.1 hypothetical protein [Phyllobacterium sp. 0TCS1.6A]